MSEKYNSGLNTETYPVDINIFIKKLILSCTVINGSLLTVLFASLSRSTENKQAAYFLYREAEKHVFWL